jgi:hypothetical protein
MVMGRGLWLAPWAAATFPPGKGRGRWRGDGGDIAPEFATVNDTTLLLWDPQ